MAPSIEEVPVAEPEKQESTENQVGGDETEAPPPAEDAGGEEGAGNVLYFERMVAFFL